MAQAILLTLLAGLSTGLGAFFAFFRKGSGTQFLSVALGLSAGVMVYISFVELLPESFRIFSEMTTPKRGEFIALLWFFGGVFLSFVIDHFIPEDINPHELKGESEMQDLRTGSAGKNLPALKRTGLFAALAIAIHNFPEGFAVFYTSLQDMQTGLPIVFAVAIHNIPEGIAVAFPVFYATGSRKKALFYAFASGLAEPVGALLGYLAISPVSGLQSLGAMYALVSGMMLYISFDELLPAARVYGNAHTTILGIVLGMIIIAFSLLLF